MGGGNGGSRAVRARRVSALADPVLAKLHAARTRLVLEKPFVGALSLHLPLVPAPERRTVACDARAIYFNPAYVASLPLSGIQFLLAHEALHCALQHFHRRGHRLKARWDVACDYAVNGLLAADGLAPPPGALTDPRFAGLSAEEIYPLLDSGGELLDEHLFGGAEGGMSGDGTPSNDLPPAPSAVERDALAQRWAGRVAALAQAAEGRLPGAWRRALDRFFEPALPWRALLARYLMGAARDDYRFARPSRREGDALFPALHSGEIELVVALDTSGSVSDAELAEFVAEIDALKGQVRANLTLYACDERVAGPWRFPAWEPAALPERLAGGGGTRFSPVFDAVDADGRRPDLLVYFTDAEGEFPALPPPYPVLWLVKGRAPVPWGVRVQLN